MTIYKRHCNTCGIYYEGQGKYYCSGKCRPYWNIPKLSDGTYYPPIPDLCWCGCGTIVWGGKRFARFHHLNGKYNPNFGGTIFKGKHPSQETRDKQSKWQLGRKLTEEHKRHIKENRPDISREKHYLYGKHHSPETCKLLSELSKMEGNSNWKGGISFLPYCHKFNNKFKESIRIRDGHICQLCGKTQEDELNNNGRKLSVHHIHHDKDNCYPDCVTLCDSCNVKVEQKDKAKYYESLFMNNLNNRRLLFWSKRREDESN